MLFTSKNKNFDKILKNGRNQKIKSLFLLAFEEEFGYH